MPFLRNEFSKIFEDFKTITKFQEMIYFPVSSTNILGISNFKILFIKPKKASSDRLTVHSLPPRIEPPTQVPCNFAQMSQAMEAQLRTDRSGALCFNQTTGQPLRDANNNLILNQARIINEIK